METILPSEVARLVVGYLEDNKCKAAACSFLENSPDLTECLNMVKSGRSFNTRVQGYSLTDIIDEFCQVHFLVQHRLRNLPDISAAQVKQCGNLVEKLKYLIDACQTDPRVNVSITMPTRAVPQSRISSLGDFLAGSNHQKQKLRCERKAKKHVLSHRQNQEQKLTIRSDQNEEVASVTVQRIGGTPLESLPGFSQEERSSQSTQTTAESGQEEPSTSHVASQETLDEMPHREIAVECIENLLCQSSVLDRITEVGKEVAAAGVDKEVECASLQEADKENDPLPDNVLYGSAHQMQTDLNTPVKLDDISVQTSLGCDKSDASEKSDMFLNCSASSSSSKRKGQKRKGNQTPSKVGTPGKRRSHSDDEHSNESLDLSMFIRPILGNKFHERLAENINKVYKLPETGEAVTSAPEQPPQELTPASITSEAAMQQELNQAIKTIVEQTEADPLFDRILEEILDPREDEVASGNGEEMLKVLDGPPPMSSPIESYHAETASVSEPSGVEKVYGKQVTKMPDLSDSIETPLKNRLRSSSLKRNEHLGANSGKEMRPDSMEFFPNLENQNAEAIQRIVAAQNKERASEVEDVCNRQVVGEALGVGQKASGCGEGSGDVGVPEQYQNMSLSNQSVGALCEDTAKQIVASSQSSYAVTSEPVSANFAVQNGICQQLPEPLYLAENYSHVPPINLAVSSEMASTSTAIMMPVSAISSQENNQTESLNVPTSTAAVLTFPVSQCSVTLPSSVQMEQSGSFSRSTVVMYGASQELPCATMTNAFPPVQQTLPTIKKKKRDIPIAPKPMIDPLLFTRQRQLTLELAEHRNRMSKKDKQLSLAAQEQLLSVPIIVVQRLPNSLVDEQLVIDGDVTLDPSTSGGSTSGVTNDPITVISVPDASESESGSNVTKHQPLIIRRAFTVNKETSPNSIKKITEATTNSEDRVNEIKKSEEKQTEQGGESKDAEDTSNIPMPCLEPPVVNAGGGPFVEVPEKEKVYDGAQQASTSSDFVVDRGNAERIKSTSVPAENKVKTATGPRSSSLCRGTPALRKFQHRRVSLSTPRRKKSHVRALDFGTPPHKPASRKAQTSPKGFSANEQHSPSSDQQKRNAKNIRYGLFKSPPSIATKVSENIVCTSKDQAAEVTTLPSSFIHIATRSPAPRLSNAWDSLGMMFGSENSSGSEISKSSSKKKVSGDTDVSPKEADASNSDEVKDLPSARAIIENESASGSPNVNSDQNQTSGVSNENTNQARGIFSFNRQKGKKSAWDADLRALVGETSFPTVSSDASSKKKKASGKNGAKKGKKDKSLCKESKNEEPAGGDTPAKDTKSTDNVVKSQQNNRKRTPCGSKKSMEGFCDNEEDENSTGDSAGDRSVRKSTRIKNMAQTSELPSSSANSDADCSSEREGNERSLQRKNKLSTRKASKKSLVLSPQKLRNAKKTVLYEKMLPPEKVAVSEDCAARPVSQQNNSKNKPSSVVVQTDPSAFSSNVNETAAGDIDEFVVLDLSTPRKEDSEQLTSLEGIKECGTTPLTKVVKDGYTFECTLIETPVYPPTPNIAVTPQPKNVDVSPSGSVEAESSEVLNLSASADHGDKQVTSKSEYEELSKRSDSCLTHEGPDESEQPADERDGRAWEEEDVDVEGILGTDTAGCARVYNYIQSPEYKAKSKQDNRKLEHQSKKEGLSKQTKKHKRKLHKAKCKKIENAFTMLSRENALDRHLRNVKLSVFGNHDELEEPAFEEPQEKLKENILPVKSRSCLRYSLRSRTPKKAPGVEISFNVDAVTSEDKESSVNNVDLQKKMENSDSREKHQDMSFEGNRKDPEQTSEESSAECCDGAGMKSRVSKVADVRLSRELEEKRKRTVEKLKGKSHQSHRPSMIVDTNSLLCLSKTKKKKTASPKLSMGKTVDDNVLANSSLSASMMGKSLRESPGKQCTSSSVRSRNRTASTGSLEGAAEVSSNNAESKSQVKGDAEDEINGEEFPCLHISDDDEAVEIDKENQAASISGVGKGRRNSCRQDEEELVADETVVCDRDSKQNEGNENQLVINGSEHGVGDVDMERTEKDEQDTHVTSVTAVDKNEKKIEENASGCDFDERNRENGSESLERSDSDNNAKSMRVDEEQQKENSIEMVKNPEDEQTAGRNQLPESGLEESIRKETEPEANLQISRGNEEGTTEKIGFSVDENLERNVQNEIDIVKEQEATASTSVDGHTGSRYENVTQRKKKPSQKLHSMNATEVEKVTFEIGFADEDENEKKAEGGEKENCALVVKSKEKIGKKSKPLRREKQQKKKKVKSKTEKHKKPSAKIDEEKGREEEDGRSIVECNLSIVESQLAALHGEVSLETEQPSIQTGAEADSKGNLISLTEDVESHRVFEEGVPVNDHWDQGKDAEPVKHCRNAMENDETEYLQVDVSDESLDIIDKRGESYNNTLTHESGAHTVVHISDHESGPQSSGTVEVTDPEEQANEVLLMTVSPFLDLFSMHLDSDEVHHSRKSRNSKSRRTELGKSGRKHTSKDRDKDHKKPEKHSQLRAPKSPLRKHKNVDVISRMKERHRRSRSPGFKFLSNTRKKYFSPAKKARDCYKKSMLPSSRRHSRKHSTKKVHERDTSPEQRRPKYYPESHVKRKSHSRSRSEESESLNVETQRKKHTSEKHVTLKENCLNVSKRDSSYRSSSKEAHHSREETPEISLPPLNRERQPACIPKKQKSADVSQQILRKMSPNVNTERCRSRLRENRTSMSEASDAGREPGLSTASPDYDDDLMTYALVGSARIENSPDVLERGPSESPNHISDMLMKAEHGARREACHPVGIQRQTKAQEASARLRKEKLHQVKNTSQMNSSKASVQGSEPPRAAAKKPFEMTSPLANIYDETPDREKPSTSSCPAASGGHRTLPPKKRRSTTEDVLLAAGKRLKTSNPQALLEKVNLDNFLSVVHGDKES